MARPPLPLGQLREDQRVGGRSGVDRPHPFPGLRRKDPPGQAPRQEQGGPIRSLRSALVDRQAPAQESEIVPDTRFGKVAEVWLAQVTEAADTGRRSPGTLDIYTSVYRRHVAPALAEMRVREITTPVVDRALGVIKKLSAARARTAKVVISGVMKLAARHGAVVYNPVREVARIDSEPRRPPRSLTAEERTAWLDAVEHSKKARDWALPDLSRMMLATGVRIGEALAVGWTEVDLDEGIADIRWRLVRRTGVGLLRLPSTKSGRKGERMVPLPSWAVTMLKRRRLAIGPGVEAVFPDSVGGWRDPANVRRVWRQVRDGAELDGLVSHPSKDRREFPGRRGGVRPQDQRPARPREDQHDAGPVPRAQADRAADGGRVGGPIDESRNKCPKNVL